MTALIGLDWGSSNLRAFRFDGDGTVVETRTSGRGAARLSRDEFPGVLVEIAGDWTDGAVPIVMAGMVGARAGWREAPYLPCPADPTSLAAGSVTLETPIGPAMLVPGICRNRDGRGDVMRGEETQLVGAGTKDGIAILPGTHSKWATLDGGRIADFSTAMTGELYELMRTRSLLGQLVPQGAPFDRPAFARGVERSLEAGSTTGLLFSARADVLLGNLPAAAIESYLSGLLIGGEIAAFGAGPATLIGASSLVARYREALSVAGVEAIRTVDGDEAAARGLWSIGTTT